MTINSKDKGARGERELAEYLTEKGFPARRGQQFKGGEDSPDVICDDLSAFHLESKRTERLKLYDAMDQAKRDCGSRIPLVIHRRNRGEWLCVLRLDDLLNIVQGLIAR